MITAATIREVVEEFYENEDVDEGITWGGM